MTRLIRYFDIINESFVDEIILPDIPLAALQKTFGENSENPMYDSYRIDKSHENFFSKYKHINFDFEKFEYFLEYDA